MKKLVWRCEKYLLEHLLKKSDRHFEKFMAYELVWRKPTNGPEMTTKERKAFKKCIKHGRLGTKYNEMGIAYIAKVKQKGAGE